MTSKQHTYQRKDRSYRDWFITPSNQGSSVFNRFTKTYTNYVVGGENPNWRQAVRQGYQAGTSLAGIKYNKRPSGIEAFAITAVSGQLGFDHWYGTLFIPEPSYVSAGISEGTADNKAKIQYMREARAANTKFSGGVFLGEMRETVRMLRSPFKALHHGLTAYFESLRKGLRRRRNGLSKQTAGGVIRDTWLEYAFGLAPIISDIEDLADNFINQPRLLNRTAIRGFGIDETVSVTKQTTGGYTGLHTLEYLMETRRSHIVVYNGSVNLESEDQPFNLGRLGFGIQDFVPTIYELIPWSFLVDYATNLGDIISAKSFSSSGIRWTMRTHIHEVSRRPVGSWYKTWNSQIWAGQKYGRLSGGGYNFREVTRTPYVGDFVPVFTLNIPDRPLQWLNIAALAAGSKRVTNLFS